MQMFGGSVGWGGGFPTASRYLGNNITCPESQQDVGRINFQVSLWVKDAIWTWTGCVVEWKLVLVALLLECFNVSWKVLLTPPCLSVHIRRLGNTAGEGVRME